MAGYMDASPASRELSLLPPHTVRIKRKKYEEPVDSLYIQVEPEQKRRRFSDFVFRRISAAGANDTIRPEILAEKGQDWQSNTPLTQTTPLGQTEDPSLRLRSPVQSNGITSLVEQSSSNTSHDAGRIQSLPDCTGVPRSDVAGRQPPVPDAFKPSSMVHVRRFHLAKSAMTAPQGPASGVRKVKRAGKTSVALLFEEIRSYTKEAPAKMDGDDDLMVDGVSQPPRKRPNTRGSHMTPRAGGSKNATTITATPQEKHRALEAPTDPEPTEFSELPDWAQDLIVEQLGSVALNGGVRPLKPLKIKPTAPTHRYRDRHPDLSDEMTDAPQHDMSNVLENDIEYVYDTYVREPKPYKLNDDENFGLLVVDNETQTAWETFDDAEFSDSGDADEDEDENAENFYANDYPDEEDEEGGAYSEDKDEDENEDEDEEIDRGESRMMKSRLDYDEDEAHWSGDDDGDISHGLYPHRHWKHSTYF